MAYSKITTILSNFGHHSQANMKKKMIQLDFSSHSCVMVNCLNYVFLYENAMKKLLKWK